MTIVNYLLNFPCTSSFGLHSESRKLVFLEKVGFSCKIFSSLFLLAISEKKLFD